MSPWCTVIRGDLNLQLNLMNKIYKYILKEPLNLKCYYRAPPHKTKVNLSQKVKDTFTSSTENFLYLGWPIQQLQDKGSHFSALPHAISSFPGLERKINGKKDIFFFFFWE